MTGVSAYAVAGTHDTDKTVDKLLDKLWVETPEDWVTYIMRKVVAENGIDSIESIPAKSRVTEYVEARQWHMFLAVRITKWSTTRAGALYGKDHATAIHALKCIVNGCLSGFDKSFEYKYANVIQECRDYERTNDKKVLY
jgi:chromosomal replication initiation ATPase DnaA